MSEYSQVRCLFCLTGTETKVMREIDEKGLGHALAPKKIKRVRQGGAWREEAVPLMPGYLFLYEESPAPISLLESLGNVLYVLRYHPGDSQGFLLDNDRRFADFLWEAGGTMGVLEAVRVGGHVRITDGAFQAFGGKVLRMDKRKQAALIELDVVGRLHLWISFDVLKEEKAGGGRTDRAQ